MEILIYNYASVAGELAVDKGNFRLFFHKFLSIVASF